MGEDLVVYKDLSGTYGLLELHCAHRRADLSYGYVEETGLRCSYHGWSYEETGRWLAMPCEDIGHGSSRFKDSIQLAAYAVEEKPPAFSPPTSAHSRRLVPLTRHRGLFPVLCRTARGRPQGLRRSHGYLTAI